MKPKQIATRFMPFLVLLAVGAGAARSSAPQGDSPPKIEALEPNSGTTTPGSKVTLYGSDFSPDSVVYIGGLQVRVTNFLNPSTLIVVTPYLRPGAYQVQLKSAGTIVRSNLTFTVLRAAVDSDIDRALALEDRGQSTAAVEVLATIGRIHPDYQVRAFAFYQSSQIYFARGDWWRWGGQAGRIFLDSDKSGPAVWTYWRYRLASDEADYLLPTNNEADHDTKLADFTVQYDVTENPEPRFYRGLINARYGNLAKASADVDFLLKREPQNASYQALAAYVAALGGDSTRLRAFTGDTLGDARALALLGEAAFLSGDKGLAEHWWSQAAGIYPLGAGLACLAGKKHLARGQQRVAVSLLTECMVMAPDSKDATEARDLLAASKTPPS